MVSAADMTTGFYFGGTKAMDHNGEQSVKGGDKTSIFVPANGESDEEQKQHESPQPSLQAHTPGKSFRSSAVKPATPSKVICANYDSDDARLIGLKQEGYSDQAVANKLAAEDRAHYLPKTVASRWARLKRIVQEIEDKKLDDELSDWHVGEDDDLRNSIQKADKKLEEELQKLYVQKWKDVATNLELRIGKKKYTAKACKERFQGLEDGTALKPIELDSDQEGRQLLREARIAENKRLRAEAASAAERERQAADWEKGAKKRARAAKHEALQSAKKAREDDQAETKRIKAERRAGLDAQRQKKQAAYDVYVKEISDKREERRKMDLMYYHLTGKSMRAAQGYKRKSSTADGGDENADNSDDNEDRSSGNSDDDDDADDAHNPSRAKSSIKPAIATIPLITPETRSNAAQSSASPNSTSCSSPSAFPALSQEPLNPC